MLDYARFAPFKAPWAATHRHRGVAACATFCSYWGHSPQRRARQVSEREVLFAPCGLRTAASGRRSLQVIGGQAAGCRPAFEFRNQMLSASRFWMVVIDPMWSRSSTETIAYRRSIRPESAPCGFLVRHVPSPPRHSSAAARWGWRSPSAFARHATISRRRFGSPRMRRKPSICQ